MTSRERVKNTLEQKPIDRIPFDNIHKACVHLPSDVAYVTDYHYGKGYESGVSGKKGIRYDRWGCAWESGEDGVAGEIKNPMLKTLEAMENYTPPWRILEQANLKSVDTFCENTDKFVVAAWDDVSAQPFQRMQYLCGTEALFMNMALEEPAFFTLKERVHNYYVKQARMWCETKVDAIHIEDDWGTQNSTLISPEHWRRFFKPLYRDYAAIAHAASKKIIMHSDGMTMPFIEDLIEIGIDALNLQLFCMDMEEMERRFGGRVTFWGELDRQFLLPFGTDAEIKNGVRQVQNAFLKNRKTGVVAMSFDGKDISDHALSVAYGEWNKVSNEMFETI
ncbi:MAG: uroporphyrinogen decarboxylase family protein [Ruthenibacterium sp.]